MEKAGALAGDELIREPTGAAHEQPDRLDELRIPVEKRLRDIGDDVAERAPVIDRHLPAIRAVLPVQLLPAIFAMRQRRRLFPFLPAQKSAAFAARLFQ